MTFSDLAFSANRPARRQTRAVAAFPNGYGASVIHDNNRSDRYEVAVLRNGKICYDTPITDNVRVNLTRADVTRILGEIAALPTIGVQAHDER